MWPATFIAAQVNPVAPAPVASIAIHFVHGRWFDGSGFHPDAFYAVDGRLTHRAPRHVDATVDLHGGFVIPPFGDAHEHNFDSVANTPGVAAQYLRDGVFYAQGVTDIYTGAQAVVAAGMVNTSSTPDVTYSHGGLTASNGHPKEVYEQYALGFYKYPLTAEQNAKIEASHLQAGNAYWEVDTPAMLEAAWPKLLAQHPDLIKVYISGSEHFAEQDHVHPPLGKGLDPAMIPLITAKAHSAGLKVAAHVDTAADFHLALVSGVDEMAHLPGYYVEAKTGPAPYRLSDADIMMAASRGVRVIATASLSDNDYVSAEIRSLTRASQLGNLRRLKQAGVPILVGADHYGEDSLHEITYLHGLGLWSNLELLRMYAVATPQDIFPKRNLAQLREGYEASFLVLADDPLQRWEATTAIVARWKQGRELKVAPTPAPASVTKPAA